MSPSFQTPSNLIINEKVNHLVVKALLYRENEEAFSRFKVKEKEVKPLTRG
jgi:hypothetical protein